ncbi:MAG TPA: SpoVG family protein [Planctomycetota bacterium]|nr:SpoVG family protein [Planctomycetota bacterium]
MIDASEVFSMAVRENIWTSAQVHLKGFHVLPPVLRTCPNSASHLANSRWLRAGRYAMQITDIVIKLTPGQGALLATADLIIGGDFVIHNLRIIRVSDRLLVAMPSRTATVKCSCGEKHPLNANFCQGCGRRVQATPESLERHKLYADIAHPITPEAREALNRAVIEAYERKKAGEGSGSSSRLGVVAENGVERGQ